ncbi:hypothetical protein HII12_002855 [Brettanomyces bruxellensis]|uniref:DEBR0S3_04720g1_1 n=1 Tax=Dekkera bruxellensis TaxID=5007 RepID=A0A7D9GZX9_DEKBR|nr:hypothetical protein HII12_002855 [Brettanomyces bruxellensis]VUG18202.1 SDS24 [Brettanomyces bruxellensis]
MSKNIYTKSTALRAPNSPSQSRQASIVEMLSSPPHLEQQGSSSSTNSASKDLNLGPAPFGAELGRVTSNLRRGVPLVASSSSSSYSVPKASAEPFDSQSQQEQQQLYSSSSLSRNPSVSSSILAGTSMEWKDIPLSELVEKNKLIVVNDDISVEDAFKTLSTNGLTSVPVEHYKDDLNCLTFGYSDLNAYLLLVMKKINPESLRYMNYEPREMIPEMIHKAQRGDQVPVSFVIRLSTKNPFIKLSESDTLSTVVEILGNGVHRIAITNHGKLTGILSQRRLTKFLWDNARRFPSMEPVLTSSLQSLNIGSPNPISIFGDQPLIEAFLKIHTYKVSSLAVIDRKFGLLGNISVTDVRLVSKSSRSDLLFKTCLHFISVILNSRGLENGQDSFPIFHVTSASSLARAMAKLVATRAHRLWIVKPDSPAPPATTQGSSPLSPAATGSSAFERHGSVSMHQSNSNLSNEMAAATAAAVTQEREISNGKLIGVLSLTDILSLLAKTLGKDHVNPNNARQQRRRSSSSASSRTSSSAEPYKKSISDASGR